MLNIKEKKKQNSTTTSRETSKCNSGSINKSVDLISAGQFCTVT